MFLHSSLLWLLPVFPLAGFLVLGILTLAGVHTRHGAHRGLSTVLALAGPLGAFALTIHLIASLPDAHGWIQPMWRWIMVDPIRMEFGFQFDALSGIMLLFVTGIGSLIVLYSSGYMALDRGFTRFMAYLNLFLASMVVLVLGDGLLTTFVGWEGVGLCSYLLIGFWHHRDANNDAARKAFVVNRVGDLGFLLGIFALLGLMGEGASFLYRDIGGWFLDPAHGPLLESQAAWVTAAILLIFLGCAGKSAQIPLQTWLPDAMAGPTPVSALIHAATMVTAGVYLMARLAPVLAHSPHAQAVIVWVGILTAVWAAVTALMQRDIKKVLAYSTVSQLGYMFVAIGSMRADTAIFHVFTHAFFKGALFLAAGIAIHALHGQQDLGRMRGLRRFLPLVAVATFCGWWAIVGLPGGAGFFSKDLVLDAAWASHGPVVWGLGILTTILTGAYMTRWILLVFGPDSPGPVGSGDLPHDRHHDHSLHGPSWTMVLPVLLLGVGSLLAGWLWAPFFGIESFGDLLAPALLTVQHADGDAHGPSSILLVAVATLAAPIGLFMAWRRRSRPVEDLTAAGRAWTFAFDSLHAWTVVLPVRVLSWILDKIVHTAILGGAIALFQYLVVLTGSGVALLQRRVPRSQLTVAVIGSIVLLLLVAEVLR